MSFEEDNKGLVASLKKDYSTFLKSFNSSKFQKLRNSQLYVLGQYANQYSSKTDIAIELPTGSGKSLISLLVAEVWRSSGNKVAILTANKTLARQMKAEADELGIASVLMEGRGIDIPPQDKRAYHRCLKIAIMNYWVYFNQNPVLDPADLLIMDDAHLAEHCMHSLYSVEIKNDEHADLFTTIIKTMVSYFPEYTVLHDALDSDAPPFTPPELLSFIDQVTFTPILKTIVDSSEVIKTDTSLKFRWERIRNSINECNIYVGLNSIWIRPYIYPSNSSDRITGTKQRLYMSATIGDPNDLGRRLGLRNIQKMKVPQEFEEATNGRRLIVMNQIEDDDLPERLQAAILAAVEMHPKSVWLCSSDREARYMQKIVMPWLLSNGFSNHPSWILTNLGDEIEQFKKASCGHLFIAGRFDGMDFNGSDCRLVILNTLPKSINIQEEFFCAYLRDAGFMNQRLNQRIIQALGRCNRSNLDFGMYVLADKRFATHFGRESSRTGIPNNIIAEIDIAEDATQDSIEMLTESVKKFITGDFSEYDLKLNDARLGTPNCQVITDNSSSDYEVVGWAALFNSKNYQVAADKFKYCSDIAIKNRQLETGAFYAWCQAKALYLDGLNGDEPKKQMALQILEQAVVKGGQSAWFNRMRASLNRAHRTYNPQIALLESGKLTILQRFDDILEKYGIKDSRFQKWADKIDKELNSESHNEFQQGLLSIGELLGYAAVIPNHSAATDCRWKGIFGNKKEIITFEAKIEHDVSGEITASAMGQAHNQNQRAITEFGSMGYTVRSCIVTHMNRLNDSAESSAGTIKIISKNAILQLWQQMKTVLQIYRKDWSLDNIEIRRMAASRVNTLLPPDGWLQRAMDIDIRWVDAATLLSEWQSIKLIE